MKKTLITTISMIFLLMPAMVYAQSEQPASNAPPPVSQQLVAEGDFALKLVTALNLGTPNNEAQAEDILTSVGIAPKNGWIADYPMTPIIIGELQNAVAAVWFFYLSHNKITVSNRSRYGSNNSGKNSGKSLWQESC
jgi:hypothetical protein